MALADEALVILGVWLTVKVKACVAVPVVFLALMVSVNAPPAVGVPAMVADPLALPVKVTPEGRAPASLSVGAGLPDALTVKLNAVPTVALADAALVILGPWPTVRVKVWVAVPLAFWTLMVIG